jgi:hypothetical protein
VTAGRDYLDWAGQTVFSSDLPSASQRFPPGELPALPGRSDASDVRLAIGGEPRRLTRAARATGAHPGVVALSVLPHREPRRVPWPAGLGPEAASGDCRSSKCDRDEVTYHMHFHSNDGGGYTCTVRALVNGSPEGPALAIGTGHTQAAARDAALMCTTNPNIRHLLRSFVPDE